VKPKPLIFILVASVLAGCGTHSEEAASTTAPAEPKLAQIAGNEGIQLDPGSLKLAGITIVTAGKENLTATVQPTGEVAPTDSGTIQITSRLPGKITAALVGVGDRVRKGEVLAWVDSVDLATAEAAYQTAVSHANLANHQLAQQKMLAGYGSLSEQPVEDARKASYAADAAIGSDTAQIKVDSLALQSTRQLVSMGEVTRKPLEDAQNAFASAQSAATQAGVTLHSTKANLDRAKILFSGGVYSKQQLEDAETAYNSAVAGAEQGNVAERLAKEELSRQQTIFNQNLNGASSLQTAVSKLQQDQHTYQNDLIAQQLAHRQYHRALTVRKSGIPVSQALQTAQDTYDEAKIAVQGAGNTLSLYGVRPGAPSRRGNGGVVIPIVSPIDGIVAARSMVVGQNTDTSTALLRLVNLDHIYVDAQVYEKDLLGVQVGDPVQIHVSAIPDKTFAGSIKWIASEVSPDTRTVTVRTILHNPGWILRPGMFASVQIGSLNSSRSIALPVDAVLQEGDKQVVYVQTAPGQFLKRAVKVGEPVGGKLPILSGLTSGDQVVNSGNVLIEKEQEKLEGGKSGSS
jgi:RND family efflux transporter MFP subunit